jgi:phage minor structural protein
LGAPVIIYDENMRSIAVLQNAFDVGYEQRYNELWQAWFSLPVSDPKAVECKAFRFVELWEGDERVDLFRILPTGIKKAADGATISYKCEHVMGTLIDDVLFQYHQTNNLSPANTLNYILSKQTLWELGTVDFTELFSYKWENENLLSAIFSVPATYSGEYMWTWDTSVSPWRLNLVRPSNEVSARILYRKNLVGIEKNEDPTGIITRIYALGYGEGINQLTIKDVNGGLPYIDADTIATYGVKSYIHVDLKEENANTLKAKVSAILEANKNPEITYAVSAADLWQITGDTLDKFVNGGLVYVNDTETGIEFNARVKVRKKNNYVADPGNVDLEIGNAVLTIADFNSEESSRQRISETYSQGATNLDSHDFADNCDPDNPAVIKFYVPAETVRINKMLLSFEAGAFRAYSKAIQGGGALTKSTEAGGGTIGTDTEIQRLLSGISEDYTESGGDPAHIHRLFKHGHKINLPDHIHSVIIPNHIHGIEYGIYEGPAPNDITVQVDGNTIPGMGTSENDVDIIPYLAKDGEGKVTRGTWHEIKITPDDLGRIVASVVMQIFVQSRGGGNY